MSELARLWIRAVFCLALISIQAHADQPARIAIVVDDLGYQPLLDAAVLQLDARIAVAILPDSPGAEATALRAAEQGREALIHLPLSRTGSGHCQASICPQREWSAERMRRHLEWAAGRVPNAVGLNNHQGSLFTADGAATRRLIEGVTLVNRRRERPLFVIDSRTTAESRLAFEAARAGIASAERQVFLDHERSEQAIEIAWDRLIELAIGKGDALAIAHPYPETIAFLARVVPALVDGDVRLVPVSQMLGGGASQTAAAPGQVMPSRAYKPSPGARLDDQG